MELRWKINGETIKEIYWSKNLSLKETEQMGNGCDQLRIWYPQNLDDAIYERYGSVMSYIEFNGIWKGKAHSLLVDLTQGGDEIMNSFSETRRYETRRAKERDGLKIEFREPADKAGCEGFFDFYNRFAQSKGLGNMAKEKTYALAQSGRLVIANVSAQDYGILSMHGYIEDRESAKVALYTSSSLLREQKNIANLIGRANGMLHYESMLYFKNKGYLTYDFGGAYLGKDNDALQNITKYKMSFGGDIAEFDNGVVIPFRIIHDVDIFIENNMGLFNGKKIIVWGAAQYGKYLLQRMEQLNIAVSEVIDNRLSDISTGYAKDSVLAGYDPKDTMIIVTTSDENYEKILHQENCRRFVENKSIISLKREIQRIS